MPETNKDVKYYTQQRSPVINVTYWAPEKAQTSVTPNTDDTDYAELKVFGAAALPPSLHELATTVKEPGRCLPHAIWSTRPAALTQHTQEVNIKHPEKPCSWESAQTLRRSLKGSGNPQTTQVKLAALHPRRNKLKSQGKRQPANHLDKAGSPAPSMQAWKEKREERELQLLLFSSKTEMTDLCLCISAISMHVKKQLVGNY